MRTLAALAVVATLAVFTTAQDEPERKPQTVDLHFLGVPAEIALKQFAELSGLDLDADGERFELDQAVWLSARSVTPGHGARLLSVASGLNVLIQDGAVTVGEFDAKGSHRLTKGYDVSVLCGRYVEYVNKYGRAERDAEGDDKQRKMTAAETLESTLAYVAQQFWGVHIDGSVVGDRILYTTTPALHAQIRELLDLLMSESGGESSLAKTERTHLDALRKKSGETEYDERPLASVLANLCIEAKADFLIDPGVVEGKDVHFDWNGAGSYLEQAKRILGQQHPDARITSHLGVVYFGLRDYAPFGSLRVFDVGELLKKLDSAYQRQRTQPGREEGFDEDLSAAGGVEVIADALDWQLFEQDFSDRVETYGARIIVGGGPTTTDAAEAILKEMGWEPPKE